MKNSTLSALALSLVLGLGGATFASADNLDVQENGFENGSSQAAYGERGNHGSVGSRDYERDGRGGSRGSWNSRGNDFEGTWRLASRRGDSNSNWNNGWNGRAGEMRRYKNDRGTQLPDVIQIENSRGAIRVETSNGRLLRQAEVGRRGANDGHFEITSATRGARVTESFSVQNRGRELVVRTIVQGQRGSQEYTSIYSRA